MTKQSDAERIAYETKGADGEPLDAEARALLVAELVNHNTAAQLTDKLRALRDPTGMTPNAHPEARDPESSTEVVRIEDAAVAILDHDRLALLKRTLASNLSDDEFTIFAARCNQARLDPFANQIHAVVRKGKMTIQTGIDGFRLIADRTGNYAGSEEPSYEGEVTGGTGSNKYVGPMLATVTVRKIVQGQVFTVTRHAHWPEFYPGDGSDGFMWRSKPYLMLAKCAEAHALRAAFPADLSGFYTDDEMSQADVIDVRSTAQPPPEHDEAEEVERWRRGVKELLETQEEPVLNELSGRWKRVEPPLPHLPKCATMRDMRRIVSLVRSVLKVDVHPVDVLPPETEGDPAPAPSAPETPPAPADLDKDTVPAQDRVSPTFDIDAASRETADRITQQQEERRTAGLCIACGEPFAENPDAPKLGASTEYPGYHKACEPF